VAGSIVRLKVKLAVNFLKQMINTRKILGVFTNIILLFHFGRVSTLLQAMRPTRPHCLEAAAYRLRLCRVNLKARAKYSY